MGGWPAGHPGSSTPQCPNRAEPPQHTPPALLQNVQSGRATRKIGLSHPPNRAEPTPSPPNGLATWLGHPDKNRAEPFFLNWLATPPKVWLGHPAEVARPPGQPAGRPAGWPRRAGRTAARSPEPEGQPVGQPRASPGPAPSRVASRVATAPGGQPSGQPGGQPRRKSGRATPQIGMAGRLSHPASPTGRVAGHEAAGRRPPPNSVECARSSNWAHREVFLPIFLRR